jgi:hypothetical protein
MPDPTIIPGSALGIPPDLLGPTGNVFFHPDGSAFSTELGVVVDHPSGKGFTYTPLLVPGQVGVPALLSGEKPTPQQIDIARKHLQTRRDAPSFATPDEATKAEKQRHDVLQAKLLSYLGPFLGPSLPSNFDPPAREMQ